MARFKRAYPGRPYIRRGPSPAVAGPSAVTLKPLPPSFRSRPPHRAQCGPSGALAAGTTGTINTAVALADPPGISVDPATPALAHLEGSTATTLQTPGFSAPAGALVAVAVSYGYNLTTATGPTLSVADGHGNTYTPGPYVYDGIDTGSGIWYKYFPTGLTTTTVTVTNSGNTAEHGWSCQVYVLDGAAASQTGAGSNTASNSSNVTAWTGSITTTQRGSWVLIAATGGANPTLTPNGSTTTLVNSADTVDIVDRLVGKQTNPTSTPGLITLGWTSGTAADFSWAALEILPLIIGETDAITVSSITPAYPGIIQAPPPSVIPPVLPPQAQVIGTPTASSAAIPVSDSGTESDTLTVTAADALTDSGSQADTLTAVVTDYGIGTLQAPTLIGLTTAPPQAQIIGPAVSAVAIALADSGTQADTLTDTAADALADSGTQSDTLTAVITNYGIGTIQAPTLAGLMTRPQQAQIFGPAVSAVSIALADSGTQADTLTDTAADALADSGSQADTLAVVIAGNTVPGVIQAPTLVTTPTLPPQAQLIGTPPAATVPVALSDAGTAADTLTDTATDAITDNGTAADTLAVIVVSYAISAIEAPTLIGLTTLGQQAKIIGPAVAVTAIALADSANVTDTLTDTAADALTDSGTQADTLAVVIAGNTVPGVLRALTIAGLTASPPQAQLIGTPPAALVPVTLSDSGTQADTLTDTATDALADSGTAADTLTVAPNYAIATIQAPTLTGIITRGQQAQIIGPAVAAIAISLTDSGSQADTLTDTAADALADSGTQADTLTAVITNYGIGTIQTPYPVIIPPPGQRAQVIGSAVITLAIALADSGTESDTLTSSAATALTDSGTAADTLAVVIAGNTIPGVVKAPVLTGLTALPPQAQLLGTPVAALVPVTLSDSGATETDTISTSAPTAIADSGTQADTLTVTVAGNTIPGVLKAPVLVGLVTAGQHAQLVSAPIITVAIALADSGTEADTLSAAFTVPVADAGGGTDALTVAVHGSVSDSGACTDAVACLSTLPDSGTVTDALSVVQPTPLTDAGHVTDTVSIQAHQFLTDSAFCVDRFLMGSVNAKPLLGAGTGSDTLVLGGVIPFADFARCADILYVQLPEQLTENITSDMPWISPVNAADVTSDMPWISPVDAIIRTSEEPRIWAEGGDR